MTTLITVCVANIGASRTNRGDVVFLDGDRELGRKTLRALDVGDNTSVIFSWTPEPGVHRLTFRVSTYDIHETDYDNNQVTQTVTVEGTPGEPEFPAWIVLCTLCIVGIILWSIWRKRPGPLR